MHEEHSPSEKSQERKEALVDILFLFCVTWLYIVSILCFPVGIVLGIVLRVGSHTEKAKKVGLIALILGLIGFGLSLIWLILFMFMGNVFGSFLLGY